MKTGCKKPIGQIETDVAREGRSIEEIMRNAIANKEPIKATANLTYNDRKDGVLPQHDIRTDRWEIAQEQTSKTHAAEALKRKKQDFPEQYKEPGGEQPMGIPGGKA